MIVQLILQMGTFIMDTIPLEKTTDDYGVISVYDHFYLVEILTTMKVIKDDTYFSFMYLFDLNVSMLTLTIHYNNMHDRFGCVFSLHRLSYHTSGTLAANPDSRFTEE
jgi:hypothetical protein